MVEKSNRTDWTLMILSLLVIGGSLLWLTFSDAFVQTVTDNPSWTWHFIRASGINAYVLLTASVVWGMFLNSQLIKDWSPGPISIAVHSTVSWLALALTAIHMGLLLLDKYVPFQILDLLIPLRAPYRPEAVGLGIVAMYMMLAINLSFAFKKRLGHVWWKRIHLLSYFSFVLVLAHAWFAGTDSSLLGLQVLLIGSSLLVLLLLGVRLGRGSLRPRQELTRASATPAAAQADLDQRRAEARARAAARRASQTQDDV